MINSIIEYIEEGSFHSEGVICLLSSYINCKVEENLNVQCMSLFVIDLSIFNYWLDQVTFFEKFLCNQYPGHRLYIEIELHKIHIFEWHI